MADFDSYRYGTLTSHKKLHLLARIMLFCTELSYIKFKPFFAPSGRGAGLNSLLAAKAQLSRLPEHVAFLLLLDSGEQLPWEELASLVLWSISLGIHTISLYDLRGHIKINQGPI